MADPARGTVDQAPGNPDPRTAGWGYAAPALAAAAEACALAVGALAARPGDPAAVGLVARLLDVLECMGGAIRMLSYGEAVAEAEYGRGYAAGYAAARGRRLRVIGGPPGEG